MSEERSKNRPKTPKKPRKRRLEVEHPLSSESEFTNREIGWLNFNRRVLHEAEDARTPLFERLRFLGICHSNLDEFFMKRVGRLKRQLAMGLMSKSADGKTPLQQMKVIRGLALQMVADQASIYAKQILPDLKKVGVHVLKWKDLTTVEKEWLAKYYAKNVFPVLTPLSVDPGHPFPFISNLSTSLGVTLRHPERDEQFFARVKIPQVLPQWVRIDPEFSKDIRFISLLDLIRENLSGLFPAMQVTSVMPFRLTRNADISRDEEDAEDLLELIEEELRLRRFAEVVRIEHGPNPDPWMLKFLMEELDLNADDVYEAPEELDFTGFSALLDLNLSEHKFSLWNPLVPAAFHEEEPNAFFKLLRNGDQLVHHPYESFAATVEKFIRIAVDDPKVLAIKMTLYRTGDNSPFIKSLIRAAESGKQVVCLVELKARFDEERNIYWAQELENAGVHVVYGIVGLKTHAKTALVVRQEADGLKCYAHFGTGNYNVQTSRLYTDLGLFTANDELTAELVEFFHYLTGRSLKSDYKHLLIAPVNMFNRFKFLIEREAQVAKDGKPALIFAKMNNMEEIDIGLSLYKASQAGVDVRLVVRGFCSLRPGIPGVSDRIQVMSVIGRFLEHSRVFYFRNGAADPVDGEFYLGSADWMYRNLHARVECVVPVLDRSLKERLWELVQLHLKDQRQTWDMDATGDYKQRSGADLGLHQTLMTMAKQRATLPEEDAGS
ncbi:MAG: polyphosphate kinase 1 [Bdellovibrionaceae bacterium]|nr:polyphosphate kinase 1 [Pseudobdellovibrionaceae bacterium]